MEKRIFIAILISIAFLWLWAAIAPKVFPDLVKKEPVRTATADGTTATPSSDTATTSSTPPAAVATPATVTAAPAVAAPVAATRVQMTVVDEPDYRAVFSNRGAQLVSFQLKKYQKRHGTGPVELVRARAVGRTDFPFTIETRDAALSKRLNSALYAVTDHTDKDARIIEFRYAGADGVSATKTFRFADKPHLFDFSVSLQPAVPFRVAIGPGINNITGDAQDTSVLFTGNGVLRREGKFKIIPREKGPRVQVFDSVDYIGIEDNYFMTVMRPTRGGDGVLWRVAQHDATKKNERRDDYYATVNAATDGTLAGQAFFGPKQAEVLEAYGLEDALQLGWFGVIARFFLTALNWINQATHNYGWSIVVLTIIIKIVLYPLQHKSIVSMKKMQKVQPKVEAIKNKYKKSKTDPDQRQKMNVEMMQLYQKEGINPMAGCLPILLQLPILWGFYNLLSRAIELRGAEWMLWIRDLSEKDPTYVLPILMTITMFIQTYITPMTGDPAQRRIFLIMPLIFGFFFKDFPSGLVLYWLVQNILTIIQQSIMNKWWKDHPQEIATA